MKLRNIIIKKSDEVPIFIDSAGFNEEGVINYDSFGTYAFKWTNINRDLISQRYNNNIYQYVKDDIIYSAKGFLAVEENNVITILVLKTNKALYLNKSLENEHLELYKRFKKSILKLYEENLDIIQTNLVGKNILLTFEPPKFSSITERQEYGGKVLEKYLEEKDPKPKVVEAKVEVHKEKIVEEVEEW